MKKIIGLVLICISLIFSDVTLSAENPITEDAVIASIIKGGDIYQVTCSVCHGDKGNADTWVSKSLNPKPRNFTDSKVISSLSRAQMFHSIHNGRPGTAMQPFRNQLSEEQIVSVIDYIRSKLMKIDVFNERMAELRESAAAKESIKLSSGISREEARQIYQVTCSVCHGDKGNAATWVRNSLNPQPRNFTDPNVRHNLSRARMVMSITNGLPGTAMQPFKHQLSEEQISAVIDYIRAELMKVTDKGRKKKGTSP
ncbi:MAG: c-type cytochrome [Nitrospinota bacterium]